MLVSEIGVALFSDGKAKPSGEDQTIWSRVLRQIGPLFQQPQRAVGVKVLDVAPHLNSFRGVCRLETSDPPR